MVEPVLILGWLSTVLKGDAFLNANLTGGWHLFPIEGSPASPFGMVRMHTAAPDLTGLNNGQTIWLPTVFQVNVYDRVRHDFTRLDPLAGRIFELLHASQGQNANGIIYDVYRVQIHADSEPIGQVTEYFITQQFAIDAKSN